MGKDVKNVWYVIKMYGKKTNVPKMHSWGVCVDQVGCNSTRCIKPQKWARPRKITYQQGPI